MLCTAKVQSNQESTVGLLTLAGRTARILVTSTRDLGRIFTSMHDVPFDGHANLISGLQKAQLALKHRHNALQRQRIVAFVSSPITTEIGVLLNLAKSLKKNSVAVDIVNVGLEGDNVEKIDAFIEAVSSRDNSRALHVRGGSNLADALMGSEIFHERDAATVGDVSGGAATAAEGADFPYGVDPSVDPELAMVLRISMEEERARQAARESEAGNAEGATAPEVDNPSGTPVVGAPTPPSAPPNDTSGKYDDNDEDLYDTAEQMDVDNEEDAEMLRRAIELSRAEAEAEASAPQPQDKSDKNKSDKDQSGS